MKPRQATAQAARILFASRQGLFGAILIVGALAFVGGSVIRVGLQRLESGAPILEASVMREGFVALGDLHRLSLALLEAEAAPNSPQATDRIIEAVDFLYVRASAMRGALDNAELSDFDRLVASLEEVVRLGDAYAASPRRDLGMLRRSVVAAANAANAELIGFVNKQQFAVARAVQRQSSILQTVVLASIALLVLFAALAAYAALLLRAEARAEAKRRAAEARAHFLAFCDPLTGLANRTQFNERAAALLAEARDDARPILILCDLDKFKEVNDTYGHGVGDALLKEMGNRIEAVVAAEGGVAARLGGDEFAAILPAKSAPMAAAELCERLLDRIREPLTVEQVELAPRATLGACAGSDEQRTVSQMMKAADLALYAAKEAGRNTYCLYDEAMAAAARRRRALERSLSCGFAQGEFTQVYQPQVRLEDGAVYGFEALTRWRRGGRLLSPNEFVSVAEATGMIRDIDIWGLERATAQVAQWIRDGAPPVGVSVNLSTLHFRQGVIIAQVKSALAKSGLPPRLLTLEITETLLLEDWDRAVRVVDELHRLGVRIALDDFGAGYSSLGYLRRLAADELKIDGSFVREIEASAQSRAIMKSFLDIAGALELELVAEGVETEGQRRALQRLGCARAQGYFFSEPVTDAEALRLVESRLPSGAPTAPGGDDAGELSKADA